MLKYHTDSECICSSYKHIFLLKNEEEQLNMHLESLITHIQNTVTSGKKTVFIQSMSIKSFSISPEMLLSIKTERFRTASIFLIQATLIAIVVYGYMFLPIYQTTGDTAL